MAFGRVVQLTIGTPGEEGIVISNLYMTFEVQKSKGGEAPAHAATIKIYNLSEASFKSYVDTQNAQNQAARLTRAVTIQAGYADELAGAVPPTLFVGQIRKATRRREHADWITEITAYAGLSEVRNAGISISFGPGTTILAVLQGIASKLGSQLTGTELIPYPGAQFPNGWAYSGPAGGALTEILNRLGMDWWVSSDSGATYGEIVLARKGIHAASSSNYLLSQATGLLLPPQMEDSSEQFANNDQVPVDVNATQKWHFTCLLFPQIQPGTIVRVDSPSLPGGTGYFDPVICTYKGDSREGDWMIDIEAYNVTPAAA